MVSHVWAVLVLQQSSCAVYSRPLCPTQSLVYEQVFQQGLNQLGAMYSLCEPCRSFHPYC